MKKATNYGPDHTVKSRVQIENRVIIYSGPITQPTVGAKTPTGGCVSVAGPRKPSGLAQTSELSKAINSEYTFMLLGMS